MCKLYHYLEVGSDQDSRSIIMSVNLSIIETEDSFANFLELAANNDVEGFERFVECEPSSIDEVGLWYGRRKGSNQMVLHHRTPLMVAATYGSIDVLKVIFSSPEVDVNRCCGVDKDTALHCAASGGSINAVNIVKLLLAAGANPNLTNANGKFPLDIIVVSPKCPDNKLSLQMLLAVVTSFDEGNLRVSRGTSNSNSPPLSQSPGNGSPCSPPEIVQAELNFHDISVSSVPEKKEYPFDPSLPDIKNSIYSTDEFRMFSFKVRPCSRAYSHDWTECPFVHPGENARRRDPRKFHYSCVMCPDFRKGACRRGDMCEYAHGVFECWLHPAQYRTRLCKDGTSCNRRVCFFAHTQVELRPLYTSTGFTVPSPRSITSASNALDFAAAMNHLPGSPSSHPHPVMSPSPFSPPLSPSTNGVTNTGWPPQQNVPALFLPGSNLQSSRLRSSLNARDVPPEGLSSFADIDVQQRQLLNELSIQSQLSVNTNMLNLSARPKTLTPSNLEEIFSAESSSPRYSDQALASAVFSPTHKAAIFHQFQQQQQSTLSPIKTNFSPRNIDHSILQSPFGVPSPGRMSPRNVEPISPMNSRVSMLAQLEKQHQQFRSLSSQDLGSEAAVASLEDSWGSPNGVPGWAITANELGKLRRSSSFETLNNGEEPDLSWVHSLVKESPQDMQDKSASRIVYVAGSASSSGEDANLSAKTEQADQSVFCAWLEQMQLDQLMAQ